MTTFDTKKTSYEGAVSMLQFFGDFQPCANRYDIRIANETFSNAEEFTVKVSISDKEVLDAYYDFVSANFAE